jgi:hypothetical protein
MSYNHNYRLNIRKFCPFAAFIIIICSNCVKSGNDFQFEVYAPQPDHVKTYWGMETNGVRAGLSIGYYSEKSFEYFSNKNEFVPIRCFQVLSFTGTNSGNVSSNDLILYLPTPDPCYRLEITDESGKRVQLTAKGAALNSAMPKLYKLLPNADGTIIDTGHRRGQYFLSRGFEGKKILPFILDQYFNFHSNGKYHMRFEMCAFKPDFRLPKKEELIWFPPVDCDIDVIAVHSGS